VFTFARAPRFPQAAAASVTVAVSGGEWRKPCMTTEKRLAHRDAKRQLSLLVPSDLSVGLLRVDVGMVGPR
jgi:hypothetical protein